MVIIGILSGIIAAVFQSISYIMSRHVLHDGSSTPLHLLIVSHIWMGLVCFIALPFVWIEPVAGYGPFLGAIAFQVFCYLGAQFSFFWTIRHAAASRISPMMGIKIIFSAILAFLVRGEELSNLQLLAVALTVGAAFAVFKSGERIPWKAMFGTLAVVCFFASSDLGITLAADAIHGNATDRDIWTPIFICTFSYSCVCLIAGITFLIGRKRMQLGHFTWPWKGSFAYAMTWLTAMIFLFTAFATIGLVFGAIAQSLRGPFSVIMAAAVVKFGWEHIEQKRPRSEYIKQILSALLMVAAIAIYCLSDMGTH